VLIKKNTIGFVYASCSFLISILFIFINVCITLCDFEVSPLFISFPKFEGTICHDTPYLSLSQPQFCFSQPLERLPQKSSISFCVSQLTTNEMACENVKTGQPLRATNSCQSREKAIVITVHFGICESSVYRETDVIFEFLKMERYQFTASSAWLLNHKKGVIFCIIKKLRIIFLGHSLSSI
jgi:hypothetical protein